MGDGEGYMFDAQSAGNFAGGAGQSQRRFAAGLADDFNINPAHAARPAGSQRLHGSFLRREAPGDVFRERPGMSPPPVDLALDEDARQEPLAESVEDCGHAGHRRQVETEENCHAR